MDAFSNESRFCLHKLDSHARTWYQVNEKYYKDCINPTVKFCGSSIMLFILVGSWTIGRSYVNIPAKRFIPWANSLLEKYPNKIKLIFQQDLASSICQNIQNECLDLAVHNKRPMPEK
ncbi:1260_t:CDS:2 [Gigaspora margarita]|uniref:1260_t:CDS:1 n=1 Tax=Gigaspora margarita TaxID=4874 RepID=A0ABN7V0B5_GIGMA|nr:1260_t:CDS:2 [Gigaspora margarita]